MSFYYERSEMQQPKKKRLHIVKGTAPWIYSVLFDKTEPT